jgi:hypothetical protein
MAAAAFQQDLFLKSILSFSIFKTAKASFCVFGDNLQHRRKS